MAELELSFITSLKQWRKRRKVDGKPKDFYLGTGKSKADRPSYDAALKKWRVIETGLIAADAQQKASDAYSAWAKQLGYEVPKTKPKPMTPEQLAERSGQAKEPLPASWQRLNNNLTGKPKGKLISAEIDRYIQVQKDRFEHGKQFPNAPRSERISDQRFIAYRYNANLLKAVWADASVPTDEEGMAQLMKDFRGSQNKLLRKGTIKPNTFNERIKTMRHFVGWLFEEYTIPALPRQITTICQKHQIEPTARAIDLETIRKIWAEASPKFKTYMALSLNCGFYQVDIANLEHSHIKGDYIEQDRHKTGVPTRFKLWAITKKLLNDNTNGKGVLALVTEDGGPLFTIETDGKGSRWSQIENDLLAIKKRLGLKGISFSNFRDTSSTKVESIDRTVTDLFNGHSDSRMARYYVDKNHVDADSLFAGLDKAVDELEKWYLLS